MTGEMRGQESRGEDMRAQQSRAYLHKHHLLCLPSTSWQNNEPEKKTRVRTRPVSGKVYY